MLNGRRYPLTVFVLLATPWVVSNPAWAQWSTDPSVNRWLSGGSGVLPRLSARTSPGEYLFAWREDVPQRRISAQKISDNGFLFWPDSGRVLLVIPVPPATDSEQLISGVDGEFLFAWMDTRSPAGLVPYIEKFDAEGIPQWGGGNGIPLDPSPDQNDGPLAVVSDGEGGAIVGWISYSPTQAAYAVRILVDGTMPWTPGGVLIGPHLSHYAEDGQGGMIFGWYQCVGFDCSVRAQRINPDGVALWGPSGVEVIPTTSVPQYVNLVPDQGGGCVLAWMGLVGGRLQAFAQHVSAAGIRDWIPATGVQITSTVSDKAYLKACPDASGGAILVWRDDQLGSYGDIFARRVSGNGAPQWNPIGVLVRDQPGQDIRDIDLRADGTGGAILAWSEYEPNGLGDTDAFVQRLSAGGQAQWGANALLVSTAPSYQIDPVILPVGNGSAITAWTDGRDELLSPPIGPEIYTQRIREDGDFGNDEIPPPGAGAHRDDNPVSFSVNGPVDPHTEGLRDARGTSPTAQIPLQPGNPTGAANRAAAVPSADGIASLRPGDVFDYAALDRPREAILFQSEPPTFLVPHGAAPDSTNNQIVEAEAAGLTAGPGVATGLWTSLPPDAPLRDNIDALSFGEDYFPSGITLGHDTSQGYPDPGLGNARWHLRSSLFKQPIVVSDGTGVCFRFSVDPWAIGLPGTAVRSLSGGADAGGPLGPWSSPGEAAGAVFATPALSRAGGVTTGGGGNVLVHSNQSLGLAPLVTPLVPMEDDLDALECVGAHTDWVSGDPQRPGNVHARVQDVAVDLPAPATIAHEPLPNRPIFFSVTRNSVGVPGSAVRTQYVVQGGAAGDIYVMVKEPGTPPGTGMTNLLFIDDMELGLYSAGMGDGVPGPDDAGDDVDGLILSVCPELRPLITAKIEEILAAGLPEPGPLGQRGGDGMLLSITKALTPIPDGCIQVGFSVTSDAVGSEYTAVDYEAAGLDSTDSSAAGDVFYAEILGGVFNPNYLWYEAEDLGLDPGTWNWSAGTPSDLSRVADNIDGLDSIHPPSSVTGMDTPRTRPPAPREVAIWPPSPNPIHRASQFAYWLAREGTIRVTVHDLSGREVATLVQGFQSAGWHHAAWDGRANDGYAVGSGIYFVRVTLGIASATAKFVIVR